MPINIGYRAVLVTRVGAEGLPEQVEQELAGLDAQRLPDIPQDDDVERAGAIGHDVFSLPEQGPALTAVAKVVETLRGTLCVSQEH